jgi:hypothetical protein
LDSVAGTTNSQTTFDEPHSFSTLNKNDYQQNAFKASKRILQQKSNPEDGDDLIPNDHITLLCTATTITKRNPAIRLSKAV